MCAIRVYIQVLSGPDRSRASMADFLSGDCLKLRAVYHEKLSHLVDCIVFASVARRGHPSAPSMSSGGDSRRSVRLCYNYVYHTVLMLQFSCPQVTNTLFVGIPI